MSDATKGKRLSGQRALVTGASSGIGASLAARLAACGADLVLTARREDRLRALAADLARRHGVDVRVVAADLAVPEAPETLFARTEGEGVAIDLLVNNAGFGTWRAFTATPWEATHSLLQVNVVALTHLTRLFLPKMLERRRGHVMNVSSVGAYSPAPDFAVYTASKVYVRNFTEALDFELRGSGVRAMCLCPGGVTTEFSEVAGQNLKRGAARLMITADECAAIAVDKMLAGRRTVIPGFMNVLGMWLLRFIPRSWMPWIARRTMLSAMHRPA